MTNDEWTRIMIHTYLKHEGQWTIWLDPDEEDQMGLCVGIGASHSQARADAEKFLLEAIEELAKSQILNL